MDAYRVGCGYDVHVFAEGRPLVIGGVTIPHRMGLVGHSDADVLIHAIIDAITGAAGQADIGTLFPDTDERYRGIRSIELLRKVSDILRDSSVAVVNIDAVVICQEPRIAPYAAEMKANIADALGIHATQVSIKGKTTEGLGFAGRREGIAAQAVALVRIG